MVRDDSNSEYESTTNNSESEEVEEESETGYSTGTGSSTSESVTSTSRRTTTEECDEETEEEDTTETSAADDTPLEKTIPPIAAPPIQPMKVAPPIQSVKVAPPIQPIKVTTIAKTGDTVVSIQSQQNDSQLKEDQLDRQQSASSDKDSLKLEPPPVLHEKVRSVDATSGNDDVSTVAVTNLNGDSETKKRSRSWFPSFTRDRRSKDQYKPLVSGDLRFSTNQGEIQEYTDPENPSKTRTELSSPKDASPSRTVTISDSGTPDRVANMSSLVPSDTLSLGKTRTAVPQQDEGAAISNDGVVVVDPTVATAAAVRCMFRIALAVLLTVGLSTIGTSYLGTELALRGYKVSSDDMDSSALPSMNDTVIEPVHNDSVVTPPFYMSPCSSGNVPLSFEIVFDSKPAEVGISLKDQADITVTNSGIWLFPALSFRSFTQFQRKNTFSVCLSNTSTFEFEITDTSGNGLVSTFGASTQVYGNWAIRLDSLVVATYFGDCNDPRRNSSVSDCGDYCRCLFNISKSRNGIGGCKTVCS